MQKVDWRMKQQERLKILLPTLREKERYVAFQIISEEPVTYSDLEAAIWNQLLDFYGEFGVSKTSMWLMKNLWNEKKQIGIIRCNNKSVSQIIAGLGLISRLGDIRAIFNVLAVSGTLKGLKVK
jgi:ribonuclease P/MRP protein subunit POP5